MYREALVTKFGHEYCVKCYESMNANPVHTWTTDNILAVAMIIHLWIQFGHKEPLMLQLLNDFI